MPSLPQGPLGLILNPAAGRGRGGQLKQRLLDLTASHWGHEVRLYETGAPGDGSLLAQRAIDEGCVILGAAGGDGTLCEVIQASAPARVPALVLPVGTGNDLVRTLGIKSIEHSLSLLQSGRVLWCDAGEIEGRLFVNILSCGFDGEVAELINTRFKALRGTAAYVAAVLTALMSYKAVPLRLEVDGEIIEKKVMLCAIANARTYGGGMKVAPLAELNDGLLDVVLVGEVSVFEFLRQFPKVFSGSHLGHPAISLHKGRHVSLKADRSLPLGIDGDVIKRSEVEVILRPSLVPLIIP